MTRQCPNGHATGEAERCDVCGALVTTNPGTAAPAPMAPAPAAPPATPTGPICPQCSTEGIADDLRCAACGYDFSTANPPHASPESAAAQPDR